MNQCLIDRAWRSSRVLSVEIARGLNSFRARPRHFGSE